MSLMQRLKDFIGADLPPPNAINYGLTHVSRSVYERMQSLYADAVRERREMQIQRDCFRAELIRMGFTTKGLTSRIELYKRTLNAAVRDGST